MIKALEDHAYSLAGETVEDHKRKCRKIYPANGKARVTARNKSLTKFMYKYAFLSKGNYQCILTSAPGYDIIESI